MRLFFHPTPPKSNLLLAEMIAYGGWTVVADPRDADCRVIQKDATWIGPEELHPWEAEAAGWVNGRCLDISKSRVGGCFEEAFGYPLLVDPLAWDGPMMVKSERNFAKDGQVVIGPVAGRQGGMCYQRFIENLQPDGLRLDYRLTIVGGEVLPGYAHWWRQYGPQVWHASDHVWSPLDPSEVISWEEAGRLARFAELIGMDFGGVDVLRDPADGLLYVIDANPTPSGLEWSAWGPAGQPIETVGPTGIMRTTAPLGPGMMPAITGAFRRAFGTQP